MLYSQNPEGDVRAAFVAHTLHPDRRVLPLTTLEFIFPANELAFFQRRYADAGMSVSAEFASRTTALGTHVRECRAVATGACWESFVGFCIGPLASTRDCLYEKAVRSALKDRPARPPMAGRGGWHLPYITPRECRYGMHQPDVLPYLSALRCANSKAYPGNKEPDDFYEQLREAHRVCIGTDGHFPVACHPMRPRRPCDPVVPYGRAPHGWIPFSLLLAFECKQSPEDGRLLTKEVYVSGHDRAAISKFVGQLAKQ